MKPIWRRRPSPAMVVACLALTVALGGTGYAAITLPTPLAAVPTPHFIRIGAALPTGCSGNAASPVASPGNLCIFEGVATNVAASDYVDPLSDGAGGQIRVYGAGVYIKATAAGNYT